MTKSFSKYQIIIFSLPTALLEVIICLFYDKNFFNIDDAISSFLGVYTQYGRIWLSGSVPLIADSLFYGGNGVVELEYCTFTPQAIAASVLAWLTHKKQLVGIFLAFFNIFIICASGMTIGKILNLKKYYAFTLGSFCAIQPFFLYFYCRSWWNSAFGQAWYMAAIAAFLLLCKNFTVRNILLNFFAQIFLLLTAWVYTIVPYAIFCLLFIISGLKKKSRIKSLIMICLPGICAILFTLPLYAEYAHNAVLHNRFVELFNNNFMAVPLMPLLLGFCPAFYDWVSSFFGYKPVFFSIAFSTIFVPAALFFRRCFKFIKIDSDGQLFAIYLLAIFLLTQTPEAVGSTRWPLRYVPIFSFALCLLVFYIMDKADIIITSVSRLKSYCIFIGCCVFITICKTAGHGYKILCLQLFAWLFVFMFTFMDRFSYRIKNLLYPISVLISLVFILAGLKFGKAEYIHTFNLHNEITLQADMNIDGFLLRLGSSSDRPGSFTYLAHSKGGIYNIKTINGYTPLGYKQAASFMPSEWTGLIFEPQKALDSLLAPVPGTEICRAIEWRISSIVLPNDVAERNMDRLHACGYERGSADQLDGFVYVTLPEKMTEGWEKLPPTAFPELPTLKTLEHGNNFDRIWVPERTERTTLVFPRQWWHGYRAAMNGETLATGPDDVGMLTQVILPPGKEGVVELAYFPETWRYLWFLPLLGILGIFASCIYLKVKKISPFWLPSCPGKNNV